MQGHCQTCSIDLVVISGAVSMCCTEPKILDSTREYLPVVHLARRWWFSTIGDELGFSAVSLLFFWRVGDADFREAVAESVAREAKSARGLTFVSVCLAKSFTDGFVFPLIKRHAGRQDRGRSACVAMCRRIEMDIGDVQSGTG